MARPMKNGLTYFPFDVDFFTDKKIKRLRAKYGADGIAVYMYLLSAMRLYFSRQSNCSVNTVIRTSV